MSCSTAQHSVSLTASASRTCRIAQAILKLEDNPRPSGCRKLRGLEGWRIRTGNWRVIYHINDQERLVTIVEIRRRREDTYR